MAARCIAFLLLALSSPALAQAPGSTGAHTTKPASSTYLRQASLGIATLQTWYTRTTGLYKTTSWWNAANAVTVLANYSRAAHTERYYPVFANTLQQAPGKYPGFINRYYDDEGWWALAWIDVYDLTHRAEYLQTAQSIFKDMTGGWDATCGGGIWWSKDRAYKNAIANELFLSVAAELATRGDTAGRDEYRKWAEQEWHWFAHSGMINDRNLVNDGLVTATCKNNEKTTWTYNQGVILGGLAELHTMTADAAEIDQANTIAQATLANLNDRNGVLHDSCEPHCGPDGVQFKGIFLRNLMALEQASPDPQYGSFAVKNAESIWKHSRGSSYRFGEVWSGPYSAATAASQTSALDAFVAAASAAGSTADPGPHQNR